jgi:hypothetical protein
VFGFWNLDVYYSFNSVRVGGVLERFACRSKPSSIGFLLNVSEGNPLADVFDITG